MSAECPRNGFAERSSVALLDELKPSPTLLALMERQPAPDPAIVAGYMSGAIGTRPATGARAANLGRLGSRLCSRQRPRSPDRKASRDRRRMLGGSSALPPNLRHHYTEGQRAVLCVIAGEVKRHGVCDWPIDKIAAHAGVCRTTVQTTEHEARRLGHVRITERPRPGRKNLPNVVEVISREWSVWIKRGPSAARSIGSNPLTNAPKMVSPTRIIEKRKEERGLPDKEKKPERAAMPQIAVTGAAYG
jgi:hypothetical protein